MAGIAVSASTGVMNSLLSKLSTLLTDEYKQLKGVRKDIEFFSRELAHMNAALETLANLEKLEPQTKVWRDMVRETAYDIDDCIDMFMHHHAKGVDKDGLLGQISGKIKKLRADYKLSNKIQELKARVMEQSESRDRYMIAEASATAEVPQVDIRVQAMFEDAKRLVGIDGPRNKITQWLVDEGDSDSQQLKVVSIVGFGGLGKTTLAKQVYNKIKNEFACTAFVSVSRNPDMPKILKDLLSGVGHRSTDMEDGVHKLMVALTQHLADKRYLIVIDDIWSITAWDIIRCALVPNDKSSRVITTTRNEEVATHCCSGRQGLVYGIQPLNKHDSRSLFFTRLFNTEDGCPKQYTEISEDMLRKCKGVPLAITSIASLLATQGMNIQKWEKIRVSMGSELETNPTLEWMRHVPSLSYNDLPHHLKTCLLYLGTYPEDYDIRRDDLLRQWIAEGFVPQMHGLKQEDVAEGYFNELINRNMIQSGSPEFVEVWSCQVHDLMLDLILLKCREENFISNIHSPHNTKGISQVRRISHQIHTRNIPPATQMMSLSQVRSYSFYSSVKYMLVVSKFELLRVLHLDTGISGTPDSASLDLSCISGLFLLRYVKVRGFLFKLPNKLLKLQYLMTLDIQSDLLFDSTNPSLDVTSLPSLRHLGLPLQSTCLELRNGVSKMSNNLQTLRGFDISINSLQTISDLSEFTDIRELELRASGSNREEDTETMALKYNALAASLRRLGNSNLRWLRVTFCAPEQFWGHRFTCPRHLQLLFGMNKIETPQVPKWMAQADRLAFLSDLKVVQLLSDDVQVLAQMPCLAYLFVQAETVQEKCIVLHSNAFPVLKTFLFYCKFSCMTFEPGAMPRLKKLYIQFDSRARTEHEVISPIVGIEHLASLEEVSVQVSAQRGAGPKLESLCRASIQRHQRYESIKTSVHASEYDD